MLPVHDLKERKNRMQVEMMYETGSMVSVRLKVLTVGPDR